MNDLQLKNQVILLFVFVNFNPRYKKLVSTVPAWVDAIASLG
jgi:hypothetical protein